MRDQIFYWKCDCPLTAGQQKAQYFSDKYREAGLLAAARKIVSDFLGTDCVPEPLNGAGNHALFRFSDGGAARILRLDDGLTDDDYMAAESAVMREVRAAGLPVPEIFETVSDPGPGRPFRYQIMEAVAAPPLNELARNGTLNESAVAAACGAFLGRLHTLTKPGAGFFNTETLRKTGKLEGLDRTARDYFLKCLPAHFAYLREHRVLPEALFRRLSAAIAQKIGLLDAVRRSAVLHRDFAYWNILGTADGIVSVIDWDDSVAGDPADDIGIVNCFHTPEFLEILLAHYPAQTGRFRARIALHTLRNMLWKMVIRHRLGYFGQGAEFFLTPRSGEPSLYDFSIAKMERELQILERES